MIRKQKQGQKQQQPPCEAPKDAGGEKRNEMTKERRDEARRVYPTLSSLFGILTAVIVCLLSVYSSTPSEKNMIDSECDLYLAPSLIPNSGRGVFAGKRIDQYSTIDKANSVVIPMENLYYQQIFNYVYADDEDDYVIAMFGTAMLYNHRQPHTVQHVDFTHGRQRTDPYTKQSPHSLHSKLQFQTLRTIAAGEEIFGDYGEEWFWTRGIEVDDSLDGEVPMKYESMEALQAAGHCLTDIEVKRSTLFGAGDGVFTRRSFAKGDIVTISPLVSIPKNTLQGIENETVLGNYCFEIPESDDVYLPIGHGAMINHGGHDDENSLVNLKVQWYKWNNNRVVDNVQRKADGVRTPESEEEENEEGAKRGRSKRKKPSPYGLYDFAYFATRDIGVGEELFISYGQDWETAWKQHAKVKEEIRKRGEDPTSQQLFRHYISL